MIVSPFALWFIIGAVVAIYSLIDDLYISRNRKAIFYAMNKYRPPELSMFEDEKLYKCLLTMKVSLDILYGPLAVYFFFRKTRKMKRYKAEMQGK